MKEDKDTRPWIFGEVLFDRFPDGRDVLGGAPFNVAWNLQALGATPVLVSRVGDDELGERIRRAMAAWGLTTEQLQVDAERPTGTVEVTIVDGEPRYDIAEGAAWDAIAHDSARTPPAGPLYHGTLALRTADSRRSLERIRAGRGSDVFVDVNLREPWWRCEQVLATLAPARWAKLNATELDRLVPGDRDPDFKARRLLADNDLEGLVVTMGSDGAVVHGPDGARDFAPADPADRVVDTVGAGDAFSAVAMLGILHGWSWSVILTRAQALAGAVVGLRGATTTDLAFYEPFITAWELT